MALPIRAIPSPARRPDEYRADGARGYLRPCPGTRALFESGSANSRLPIVGDVRGSHFMMCVENVADKETRNCSPEIDIGKRIATDARRAA